MEHKAKPTKPPMPQAELDLDSAFYRTFNSHDGKFVLDHLRAVLVHEILNADATDAELRYREGQRSVVAIIEVRKGRAEKR